MSDTEAPKLGITSSFAAETVPFVAEKFGLNKKQEMVYNIISQKFINQNILKVDESTSVKGA